MDGYNLYKRTSKKNSRGGISHTTLYHTIPVFRLHMYCSFISAIIISIREICLMGLHQMNYKLFETLFFASYGI